MRNMSFAMTTEQILAESKTVTRRFGWWFLKPGDRLCAVRQAMGLRKGEQIERLKIIEVVSVRKEPLCNITGEDCVLEGFPEWASDPDRFVNMLIAHYKCSEDDMVNRIEFKYVEGDRP